MEVAKKSPKLRQWTHPLRPHLFQRIRWMIVTPPTVMTVHPLVRPHPLVIRRSSRRKVNRKKYNKRYTVYNYNIIV